MSTPVSSTIGFRDYDPTLGRYLQPDPIDLAGGINLYAYPSNPLVHVDLLGLVHKKKPESTFEPGKKPPHDDIPLDKQTAAQLQETCKFHADALADLQENVHNKPGRERFRNQNTFAVAAVRGPDGKVKLVATMNDGKPSSRAKQHMTENGVDNRTNEPPQLKRKTVKNEDGSPKIENGKKVKETVDTSDNDKPFDKKERSDHHAEQRAERSASKNNEELVAQSPSQPCCSGCRKELGDPAKADKETGARPLDKIPPDRQGTDE
jgi:uncharacterized protein RhaS with RHS repeats